MILSRMGYAPDAFHPSIFHTRYIFHSIVALIGAYANCPLVRQDAYLEAALCYIKKYRCLLRQLEWNLVLKLTLYMCPRPPSRRCK